MKRIIIFLSLAINSSLLFAQTTLTIEGTIVNNTDPGTWAGINIPRNVPTTFTYRNNSITSVNTSGYMLQAGDDNLTDPGTFDNLDGEVITGNQFIWNGTCVGENSGLVHGCMISNNIDAVVKYNYIYNVVAGVISKAHGTTYTSGGIAYNIFSHIGLAGINLLGINNVPMYNNTFYSEQVYYVNNDLGVWRGIINITNNNQNVSPVWPTTGIKIKNNIFYTKHQIPNISIHDAACLTGFESDYNVFYCEAGTPVFEYLGVGKTFAQWQALGYDKNSVVVNPNFLDFTSFVPTNGLFSGTNLGTEFQTGLATTATWVVGSAPATTDQGSSWQVGARIYDTSSIIPFYISSVVENTTPTILEITYSLSLANIVPDTSAFDVKVNAEARTVNSITIVGRKVQLTLASRIVYGDDITIAYSKPTENPLQTVSGDQVVSITAQPVVNNCINVKPTVIITSPGNDSTFSAPVTISITASASDVDGTISKVEFYNGSTKLGEKDTAPYSFSWTILNPGTYFLTANATDNSNTTTTSTSVEVYVTSSKEVNSESINLFPNPNMGHFTIEIISPLKNESNKISVANLTGEKVYDGILLKEELTKQFDLSYLNSGIYILMIIGKEILVTKKFIKN
jgi:hypothetical protein